MAERVPARLTSREGRRFGLTVGTAFLVLAGILWWRGRVTTSIVFAAVGGALVMAALVMPTRLGPVERLWMALAHAISRVTTPIVMAVMYFVILTPAAVLRRLFGENPLVHRDAANGFWKTRPVNARRSASMERQF